MAWHAARRGARCVVLGLALVLALCACSAMAPYLSTETPASPTVSAEPTDTAVATPIREAVPSPSATAARPTASPPAVESPTLGASATHRDAPGLVYARGTSVLQTGYLGGDTREIAVIPPYDAWAFDDGRLALALGPAVEVIDLEGGSHASWRVETDAAVEFAKVFWGDSNATLLHAAFITDPSALTFARRIELRALSAMDGRVLGLVTLPDLAGVTVLRYDEAAETVTFIPRGGDPSFAEVRVVRLGDGSTVATYAVQGEGEAILAPDGRHLLVSSSLGGATRLVLHDLAEGSSRAGPETRAVAPVWSPDGLQIAFLSWQGADSAQGLDLHVLDTETMENHVVLSGGEANYSLIGWTPDGSHIVGYHIGYQQGAGGGAAPSPAYVFAVRPDGGDRRILNLGAEADVFGWMPMVAGDVRVAVDPWASRFAQTQGDADALAAVAAEFVAAHADEPDEALSAALGERILAAGWQPDLAGPQVRRVDEGLYVVQLPPLRICLLEGGAVQCVASGHLVMDARREGGALGLIYGVIGASSVQPMFVLLGRDDAGTWTPRWSPQGQRDWVATDGEIRFDGEGVGALRVSGTSFGIVLGEDDVLAECHACPHRTLSATWRRDGEGYARVSALPADASLPSVIWEMTEPTPYAVVHEALRRARAGEDPGDLATAEALQDLGALGLLAPGVRLMPEEVRASGQGRDGEVILGGEDGARYRAAVHGGRLVDVTADSG